MRRRTLWGLGSVCDPGRGSVSPPDGGKSDQTAFTLPKVFSPVSIIFRKKLLIVVDATNKSLSDLYHACFRFLYLIL